MTDTLAPTPTVPQLYELLAIERRELDELARAHATHGINVEYASQNTSPRGRVQVDVANDLTDPIVIFSRVQRPGPIAQGELDAEVARFNLDPAAGFVQLLRQGLIAQDDACAEEMKWQQDRRDELAGLIAGIGEVPQASMPFTMLGPARVHMSYAERCNSLISVAGDFGRTEVGEAEIHTRAERWTEVLAPLATNGTFHTSLLLFTGPLDADGRATLEKEVARFNESPTANFRATWAAALEQAAADLVDKARTIHVTYVEASAMAEQAKSAATALRA
ncbi:hypothetical protein [Microbacterium sp. 77mftsu3.1]|uniref:hypothetical protein n=1 Tax=Microbacterium sp. 77mftsu3.1 TaxID=1761802 RepID=UPI000363D9C3|nr:hypothetical protein [Microbacterium sp. 77mftsu3.1]SDH42091.1 hypothetical protein SAMN04488590_3297 [Microbacterium sp. 77mftsu3.1]